MTRHLEIVCRTVAWSFVLIGLSAQAFAQVYSVDVRPSGITYQVTRTAHFDLIYESGYEREAVHAGRLLEASLSEARTLLGDSGRFRTPVVLNAFSDRANGFVTPFPYKMELEIPSLKGNGLSPRHESWLHAVTRHELVHALHAEFGSGPGTVGLFRIFAPDIARSINLLVPPGVAEGVAVLLESEGRNGPGRLNHSLFQMEFRAALAADRPWSLAQMLERPRYSLPVDRFYHGGSFLYQYLYRVKGPEVFRRSQRFHYWFPFLGYGPSLWFATGKYPRRLRRDFVLDARQEELERQARLGTPTDFRVVTGKRGLAIRRPLWLNETDVVVFASGYHLPGGFYRTNTTSGRMRRLSAQKITEDVFFSVTPERDRIVWSRYIPNAVVASRSVAEAFELDVSSSDVRRLTRGGRVFTPTISRTGQTWGSVNAGQFSTLARIGDTLTFPAVPLRTRTSIKATAWSPTSDTLAVLINRDGHQGIVLVYESEDRFTVEPVLFSGKASILDFSWLPDGQGLIFASDLGEVPNVFAYTSTDDRVYRLTNVTYGAFEGSVSPTGSTFAFIEYQHEQWRLAVMPFDLRSAESIDRSAFADLSLYASESVELTQAGPPMEVSSRPYRAIRYLAPREVFPIFDFDDARTEAGDVDLGFGVGAAVASADPLQQWSYLAAGYVQADKFWGQFRLQTGKSILRPSISAFRTPSTRIVQTSDGIRRVGREEDGVRLRAELPVTLSSNIFSSAFAIGLEGQYSRSRLFGRDGEPLTDYVQRASLIPTAILQVATHGNLRDIRLSSGLVLGATSTIDVWSETQSRRALIADARWYMRTIPGTGGSLSLGVGFLWQNRPAVYDLDLFLPRGRETDFLPSGSFVKYGAEIVHPLLYVDNGLFILPIFLKSIYAYGFAETVTSARSPELEVDSIGGGIGIQMRLLYAFNFELRFGTAWLPDRDRYETIFR